MQIQIKAHHVSVTSALREYAEKKLEKLERFYDHIQEIVIDLNVESVSNVNEQQVASAVVHASGTKIHAEERAKTMYASIDGLLDKLEIQLKKYKEKNQSQHKETFKHVSESNGKRTINRSAERFIPKPMEVEEAARIVSEEKLNFLVFRNIENERICVIHPAQDDAFELIET